MSEYRRAERIDCDIILNKIQDGHTHVCRATNISLSGIRLQRLLDPLLEEYKNVRLQFELPGGELPIWIGAKKIYEDKEFVGLSFTNMSHKHFLKLRLWLKGANSNKVPAHVRVEAC